MSKFKQVGGFKYMRTIRNWILEIEGEPIRFNKKSLAIMGGAAAKTKGLNIKLIEKTTLRYRSGCGLDRNDKTYQIDITHQIP